MLVLRRLGAFGCACGLLSACGDGGGQDNVFPTTSTSADTGAGTATNGGTTTGDGPGLPDTYRFDCLDVQIIGDADGSVVQGQLLEQAWNNDIDKYRLNVLIDIESQAGTDAMLQVRSGIGTVASDLCAEPSSESPALAGSYDAAAGIWVPLTGVDGECAKANDGAEAIPTGGTYELAVGPEVILYIYAQDATGTTFNCTVDPQTADAVPVRAVTAAVTLSTAGDVMAGTLHGCLLASEGQALCSCIGSCLLTSVPECDGCPSGARPLTDLLAGVNPSAQCSAIMGAPAYDLRLGFSGTLQPIVPLTCD